MERYEYKCMHTCTYKHIYTCIHTCIDIYMHTHIQIYKCMHTYFQEGKGSSQDLPILPRTFIQRRSLSFLHLHEELEKV